MFTGIVQALGRIVRVRPFEVESGALDLADIAVGDSICVQGVCLTVTALTGRGFTAELARFIARKGSICIDGVSLTVNRVQASLFEVYLIPHTLQVTTLGRLLPGARVNLEVDLIARYVVRSQEVYNEVQQKQGKP